MSNRHSALAHQNWPMVFGIVAMVIVSLAYIQRHPLGELEAAAVSVTEP